MSPICFSRFDALAEEPRGAVLDNMFMGGICNIKRPLNTQLYHRVPHNFETFNIKVVLLLVPDLSSSQKKNVIFLGMAQDFNFTLKFSWANLG